MRSMFQKSLLSFPDKRSFSCWMCSYLIKLPYDLPSPPHLLKTFEDIFSAHSGMECLNPLEVFVEDNQMIFFCTLCSFSEELILRK